MSGRIASDAAAARAGTGRSRRTAQALIDDLAVRQHGVVARVQLLRTGISPHVVERSVARRRLEVVYRGVYRVGPVAGPLWRELAAVLACGPSAQLSHGSAASVWRVHARPADSDQQVIVARAHRVRRRGIQAFRMGPLRRDEVTAYDGVPITTPARTLLDLAGLVSVRELERALAHAERERLATGDEVRRLAARYPQHAGIGVLRALLESDVAPALTRSEAEKLLLDIVRRAKLPAPHVNARVKGLEVDFHWPAARLVVEVDGAAWHSSRAATQRDKRRDATLVASGLRVMRFTWADLVAERDATLVRLAYALRP